MSEFIENLQLRRKLKFTPQFDQMDCGPACIRMIASYWGKTWPLPLLRHYAGLSREGVSMAGIKRAFDKIGMDSAAYRLTIDQLVEVCPMPAILYWEQNHFVVLNGIHHRHAPSGKRLFRIANPACGQSWMTEDDLAHHWLSGDVGIALVAAPDDDHFSHTTPPPHKQSLLKFARRYVSPFRGSMSVLALCMAIGLALTSVTPFVTQALVDKGIAHRDLGLIGMLLLAQIAIFVGNFSQSVVSNWVALAMGTRININLLSSYLQKLLRLPMHFFDTKSVGDYNQRINDHARLQSFVTQGALQTLFSLITVPVLAIVIGYYSLKILGVYLLFTAFSLFWMAYFMERRKVMDYEQFRLNAKNQNKLFEMMSGITEIKLASYEKEETRQWQEVQEQLYRMNRRVLRLNQWQSAGFSLIGQLRNVLLTFWIASEVVHDQLTLGMMMSISAIMGQLDAPLSSLISFVQQLQDARISLERSEEVHLSADEDKGRTDVLAQGTPLSFKVNNLSFAYPGNANRKALEHVSLDIPAGKMTAIVGESGSGKTTLMKLLLSFYSPSEGHILLSGKDLQSFTAQSVRQRSGIVMQDGFIFSDSLGQNICLGEPFDVERMEEALQAARLSDWVKSLPLGLRTKVGTEGNAVSGGERQRIMIARAIYKRPSCLFFDEATSSLDAENERLITENIDRLFAHTTRIVIAHRLSTVCQADQIVVLHQGHVVEVGTHQALIDRKGFYYELVKNQLELGK